MIIAISSHWLFSLFCCMHSMRCIVQAHVVTGSFCLGRSE